MKKLLLIPALVIVTLACREERPRVVADVPKEQPVQPVQDEKKYEEGKKLFKANCASCHYADDRRMVGPGLQGTRQRVPKGDWLYKYVWNSKAVRESGDAYAIKIHEEYNYMEMLPFPQLTKKDIDAIFDWIDYKYPPKKP